MSKPNFITTLMRVRDNQDGIITYHFHDGTTVRQPLNNHIFYDEKKKHREWKDIIADLNSISHDKGAARYEVN